MRLTNDEFQQKPLRVHSFLAGVPLHDVWIFNLHGGGEQRTLRAFRALWSEKNIREISPFVRVLFKLRSALGNLFGWDREKHQPSVISYTRRLTDADRKQSRSIPGSSTIGPFSSIYAFENEALDEVINVTVHAFSLMAMEPAADGYVVYWAIYVNKVKWWTPAYMAVIDPFRRFFVYPAIITKMQRAWIAASEEDS